MHPKQFPVNIKSLRINEWVDVTQQYTSSSLSVSSTETTYVVKKTYGSETVYICFNNGNSATTFRASGTDLVTGANYSGTVYVPALSAVFVLAK